MQFDPPLHMIALIRFEFGFERNVVVCEGTFGFNDNGVGSAGKTGKWRDAICERIYTVERNRKSNFEEKHLKWDRQLGQNSAKMEKGKFILYSTTALGQNRSKFDLWLRSNLGQNSGKKQLATAAHVPEVSTRACPVFFDNHSDKIILFGNLIQSYQF